MDLNWEVDDGYVGGHRPHSTRLRDEDIRGCETFDEVLALMDETVQADFDQSISLCFDKSKHEDEARKIWEERDHEEN